ncbi:hypothetical protein D3C79_1001030 [compost metagenome]
MRLRSAVLPPEITPVCTAWITDDRYTQFLNKCLHIASEAERICSSMPRLVNTAIDRPPQMFYE